MFAKLLFFFFGCLYSFWYFFCLFVVIVEGAYAYGEQACSLTIISGKVLAHLEPDSSVTIKECPVVYRLDVMIVIVVHHKRNDWINRRCLESVEFIDGAVAVLDAFNSQDLKIQLSYHYDFWLII